MQTDVGFGKESSQKNVFGWFWSGWADRYLEDIGVVGVVDNFEGFVEGLMDEGVGDVLVDLDVFFLSTHITNYIGDANVKYA